MNKGTYLITGSSGFIGSNLVYQMYKKYKLISLIANIFKSI